MGAIVDISEVVLDAGLESSITETERALVNTAIGRAEAAVKRFLRYDPVRRSRIEYYPRGDRTSPGYPTVWEATDAIAYERQVATGATSELILQHLPVRSITNLWIDYDGRFGQRSGSFAASTLKTLGTDYWASFDETDDDGNGVCRDGIIRSQGLWPVTAGSVKVEYVAGYSLAEFHGQKSLIDATAILETVVNEAVRRLLKVQNRKKKARVGWTGGPITSESLGDYSYSMDTDMMAKLIGPGTDLMDESKMRLQEFMNMGIELT
jgi:hypothetical protein